jgi:ribonuclease VapC
VNDGEIVADASAILAALKNEPFTAVAPERVVGASISAVNLSEVLAKLAADGLTEAQADTAVTPLDLRVFPFDRAQAVVAARLWSQTRGAGLSLGDRTCLALGLTLGRPVLTADRAWANLDIGAEVILIR